MNKTALITGASRGIGLELAKVFAQEGYNLVINARDEQKLMQLKAELEHTHPIKVFVYAGDLSIESTSRDIYEYTLEQGIVVDVLVNNAGFGDYGEFAYADIQKQLDLIRVNISALTALCGYFTPHMVANRSGMILNVASTAAFQPGPMMSVYFASKAYVLSFSEALETELFKYGITVSALCPGPTGTDFSKATSTETSKKYSPSKRADSKDVALYGYKKLMQGKRVAIPGFKNKLLAALSKLLPNKLVCKVIYYKQN